MEFETEEQQVEAIKKWWKEYGMTIAVGLTLGIVGMFGYQYHIESQEAEMASASDAYQEVADRFEADGDNTAFIEAATEFNKAYSDSIYNNLVSLQLAKLAVDAGDMGTAEQHLRDAYTKAKDATVEHFARLRLARVLVAADKADEALKLIADTKEGAFKAAYELVRGDIWMAKGDEARARAAYESAKALNAEGPVNPSLEMLLTDLAASGTASEAKAEG